MTRAGLIIRGTAWLWLGWLAAGSAAARLMATDLMAQASGQADALTGLKVRKIHPAKAPSPFPLEGQTELRTQTLATLAFLVPEAMAAGDRALLEGNEDEITRRAERVGFHLDATPGGGDGMGTSWGYEQAVCPVFPEHLVIEYSRVNGTGDVSLFTVVIPRGEGHVRVIPAQRRSYSLFTPVSKNELTINDFNHMVKEEGSGLRPDWLTSALCYAALAHGHVRAALVTRVPAEEEYPLAMPARLQVTRKGGAEVRFGEAVTERGGKDWELKFAQSGRLLTVKRPKSSKLYERPVVQREVEAKGVPTQQSVVEVPAAQ